MTTTREPQTLDEWRAAYFAVLARATLSGKRAAALEAALIEHRGDLHGGSTRPCSTCRQSAEALNIVVPNQCARRATDIIALGKRDATSHASPQ